MAVTKRRIFHSVRPLAAGGREFMECGIGVDIVAWIQYEWSGGGGQRMEWAGLDMTRESDRSR